MEKLNNWNGWCGDKVVLHSSAGLPIVLSPNAILGLEQTEEGTSVALVDGIFFDVKEDIEEVLKIIGEALDDSNARREAKAEEQRKQYEEMMKSEQDQKAEQAKEETSEGQYS